MWWQWLLVFLFLVITAVGYLASFYLGAKSARGELKNLFPKAPPRPEYNDPVANKARREAERKAAADRKAGIPQHIREIP
jgi:hypothetical protein